MKRALFLVSALALGLAGNALAQSGAINAEPNPCRIRPGERECRTHITWETQGVARAKVLVKSEGKDEKVHEFSSSAVCRNRDCPAPWIRPDTRYVFKLYDFSEGRLGRELSQVTVTGERER